MPAATQRCHRRSPTDLRDKLRRLVSISFAAGQRSSWTVHAHRVPKARELAGKCVRRLFVEVLERAPSKLDVSRVFDENLWGREEPVSAEASDQLTTKERRRNRA